MSTCYDYTKVDNAELARLRKVEAKAKELADYILCWTPTYSPNRGLSDAEKLSTELLQLVEGEK